MSFVMDVLSSAVKTEAVNIAQKISDIIRRIEENKREVITHVDCIKNVERPRRNLTLLNKTNELVDEANRLENAIEEISKAEMTDIANKAAVYKTELCEVTTKLKVSSQLIHVHEILLCIGEFHQTKQYVKAMNAFNEVTEYMTPICDEAYLDIFDELRDSVIMEQWFLVKELSKIFDENVECCEEMPYVLKIRKKNDEFSQVLFALAAYKSSITSLDAITRFLWNCIFSPIINYKTKIEQQEGEINIFIITVTSSKEKDSYKDVFNNIIKVLEFLANVFNYALTDTATTLSYIGNDLQHNLSELLIKNCLNDTVPSNSDDLPKYKTVIDDVEVLQRKLIECNIFNNDTSSILDHANNVDVLFINKKCQEYLLAANVIIKKDLHDMVEVGTPNVNLSSENFVFQQCFVSRSCIELLGLAEEILQQAVASTDLCGDRLYCTVLNIFNNYGNLVREHHQKLLQTIPQQVALFHNNCMYMSHRLIEWEDTYKEKLPTMFNSTPPVFRDKAHTLRSIGNKVFIDCLQQQINQIEDIMKESGVVDILSLEQLDPVTEKSIRQCLRQQELLKTVWQKVLCISDYNRTIGSILDFLCNYIVNSIVRITDISSVAAEQLVEMLKVILIRGPKLFTDSKEIYQYVQQWQRINELVFVLSSNLLDINDRWADGKGPLALQFKPEELKQLIQALFQNTERRAALLRKIT